MKLVTMTRALFDRFGVEKSIELLKTAGFDGFDFTMLGGDDFFRKEMQGENALDFVKGVKKCADYYALPCLQAHAPCPSVPSWMEAKDYVEYIKTAIEYASEVECPLLVVHPGAFYTAEQNKELIYSHLMPTAQRLGVKIATENMYCFADNTYQHTKPAACGTVEDFVKHVDSIGDPYFTACLDIGHAQMENSEGAPALIRGLGKDRLGALHVHDNDLCNDDHTFPFMGKSDWEEITAALAEVGYEGAFTYEADAGLQNYPNELIPAMLMLLEKTGRYLIGRIEAKKKK